MTDPRLINMAQAIANVSNDCIAAGVAASDVISSVADGLGQLLTAHCEPEQAAALLRLEAGKIERTIVRQAKTDLTADAQEGADLWRKGHEFINTMQVAGLDEQIVVTTLALVVTERVARLGGAEHAARWLEGMAKCARETGDQLGATSGSC